VADISRRAVLRAVSLAGATSIGAATGFGTHALLSDGEFFGANDLSSGSLDLQVAAETETDGEVSHSPPQDDFPSSFADESGVTVAFPEVEPRDGRASGSTTIAFRVCDNPGRVWLRPHAGDADSDLAERLDVTLSYAAHYGGPRATIYDGSLAGLLDAFGDGVQLGAGCRELGKVELDEDTFVVDDGTRDSLAVADVPGSVTLHGPDGPVTIEVAGLHWTDEGAADAEIRGVDLASESVEFCRVDVKGGGRRSGGVETYHPGCPSAATDLLAGENPGGQPSGLSHFVVYDCPDGDPCVGCDPACLELDWTLPGSPSVAGDSLSLDLELYASQCRHSTSQNPWN